MEINSFPNKLKFFRHCCGYSQKKIARLIGLADTSMLSLWESGKAVPSMTQVFRLSRIYRTYPQDLFAELWQQVSDEYSLLAQDDEPSITSLEKIHM